MPPDNAKQLIVERIRQATNILVAVGTNPSVDALSAALATTLLLNKLDKHATAVFSGQVPPAMQFLQPNKTFENTVDSLRDFIISLDKEKADRLRYKVEDDVVRIFITPYKTTITQDDLQFSQGDFNVELIIALGVDKREDLDKAIVAHGRILHDATVVTIKANNQSSSLGAVDWHDMNASSLSEMITTLTEGFGQPGLLDAQISTALLTGLVASTERFSNKLTTPRVMTMAAQLMAAGANQQLVASNLQTAAVPPTMQPLPSSSTSVGAPPPAGELDIAHKGKKAEPKPIEKVSEKKAEPKPEKEAEAALTAALPALSPPPTSPVLEELKAATEEAQREPAKPPKPPGSESVNTADDGGPEGFIVGQPSWRGRTLQPPKMGGTLNATTEQAAQDSRRAQDLERNQTLLSHRDEEAQAPGPAAPKAPAPPPVVTPAPLPEPPLAPAPKPLAPPEPPEPPVEPLAPPVIEPAPQQLAPPPASPGVPSLPPLPPLPPLSPQAPPPPEPPMPALPVTPPTPPPPEPLPAPPVEPQPSAGMDIDAARQAVNDALASQPFNPAGNPQLGVGTQSLPEAPPPLEPPAPPPPAPEEPLPPPSFGAGAPPPLPPLPSMPPTPPVDPAAPLAGVPPMPDLPTTPPVPPTNFEPPQNQPQPPVDPGQFKIPGQ